jgi:ABC transporter substrate binding protein
MKRREFIAGLGGAVAWPLGARAQQGERVRRIGVLMTLDENDPEPKARLSAFTQALADLGWHDGRNVRMDLRWAGSDTNRMRALAQELVRLQPDIIVATSTPATVAVQRETRTIPIVFGNVSDHVVMGITPRSTSQAGISPASPSWKPRWAESSLSCSGRSRLDSSGPQSCSILTRLSHRLLCHHLRRPPGRSRSCQSLRPFMTT